MDMEDWVVATFIRSVATTSPHGEGGLQVILTG